MTTGPTPPGDPLQNRESGTEETRRESAGDGEGQQGGPDLAGDGDPGNGGDLDGGADPGRDGNLNDGADPGRAGQPGGIEPEVTLLRDRIRTNRSRGMELIVAAMVAIAIMVGSGSVFVLTVPLILGLIYHRATSLPPIELSARRDFSQVSVVPGETVTVEVTITNHGDSPVPDLRIRDHVPERLSVIEGSPMASVSLEPGGTATVAYKVTARRGRHDFNDVEIICRNASGSERERRILKAERTLVAKSSLGGMPLEARSSQYTGRLETSSRGSGVEFYSTREYHPSDSPRDIDWRTFAKTREFTTVEYKDTRAASIHLIVDRRRRAQEQTGANAVTSREMCLYAAEHVAEYLIEDRHKLGVTSIGDTHQTHFPEKNTRQYRQVRREFSPQANGENATADTDGGVEIVDPSLADEFVANTASYTQFVCVTGLYDEGFDAFLERLGKHDRPVLVISPRHEMVETPGSMLTLVKRDIRIDSHRRQGIRVLDWDTEEPLRLAIERRVGGLWK